MSDTSPSSVTAARANTFTSDQVEELNKWKQQYKIQYEKYNKSKLLFEALREATFNSNVLEPQLKTRVQDILLEGSCAQVINLEESGPSLSSNTLLGLTNLDSSALSYTESAKLKKAVELTLQDQYKNICEHFCKITGENINVVQSESTDFACFNLSSDDEAVLDLKNKLEEQQKKYLCNLLEEQRVLEDIVNLRLEKVPRICKNKVVECQLKSQMSVLQSKLVQEKTRIDIFTETSSSLSAYEELIKDIKTQQEDCHRDVQFLKELKEKYKRISCKQYNEILKQYVQYKSSLAKKKMIYESLQC